MISGIIKQNTLNAKGPYESAKFSEPSTIPPNMNTHSGITIPENKKKEKRRKI